MRIAWITDPHLNFLDAQGLINFVDTIKVYNADALFITGDIAEAPNVAKILDILDVGLKVPIYFVLGNHDYYHGSIRKVREWATSATEDETNNLFWMPAKGVVALSETTAVVGVDGWGDGRLGNAINSDVFLNDWLCTKELLFRNPMSKSTHVEKRIPRLRGLGKAEAKILRPILEEALKAYEKVYVITHVPPWKEATWHMGAHSEDNWLPWFSCGAVGTAISELGAKYPEKQIIVLCGHTHGEGTSQIAPNILAITGRARYRYPEVNRVFEIP